MVSLSTITLEEGRLLWAAGRVEGSGVLQQPFQRGSLIELRFTQVQDLVGQDPLSSSLLEVREYVSCHSQVGESLG